jgi:phosphotransferase system HPr (HPr) family protein
MTGDRMAETTIFVTNEVGLHARPASLFVQAAKKFTANIKVSNLTTGCKPVNAKSILSVLTLGVQKDHQILIQADGPDEDQAIQELQQLIDTNFGEG